MLDKKKNKKQQRPALVRTRVRVRHEFTTDEWKEKSSIVARKMQEVELKTEAVKANQASAKAEIKELKSEVAELANELRNGYLMKDIDATVEFNRKKGTKRYYHFAPGQSFNRDFIREEAMSEDDFQDLPLPGDDGAPMDPKEDLPAAVGLPNPVITEDDAKVVGDAADAEVSDELGDPVEN